MVSSVTMRCHLPSVQCVGEYPCFASPPLPLRRTEQLLAAEGEGKDLFLHSSFPILHSRGFICVCFGTFLPLGYLF